jgi:hypothetical protein
VRGRRVDIKAILRGVLSLRFKHVGYAAIGALIGTFGLALSGLVTGIAIWKAHEGITWWLAGTPSDSWLYIGRLHLPSGRMISRPRRAPQVG